MIFPLNLQQQIYVPWNPGAGKCYQTAPYEWTVFTVRSIHSNNICSEVSLQGQNVTGTPGGTYLFLNRVAEMSSWP